MSRTKDPKSQVPKVEKAGEVPAVPRPVSQELLQATLKLLREAAPGGLSKRAMASSLDVSDRTISGALDALIAQGAVLKEGWAREDDRRVKSWTFVEAPAWDETLNPEAGLALQVLLSALGRGMAGAWAEHLQEVEALVEGKILPHERATFERLKGSIHIRGGRTASPPAAGVLGRVLASLGGIAPRRLNFSYASAATGATESLQVVPWSLLHDVFSGGAFLLCWDFGRQAPSLLRLNRILHAADDGTSVLTKSERSQLERCSTYQIGGFISVAEPEEITVRVSGRLWVRAFLDSAPGLPEVSVTAEEGGTVLVRFMATEYKAPARWVLQMGPDATVLGPADFRTFVARRAEDTAAVYRVGPA